MNIISDSNKSRSSCLLNNEQYNFFKLKNLAKVFYILRCIVSKILLITKLLINSLKPPYEMNDRVSLTDNKNQIKKDEWHDNIYVDGNRKRTH